MKQLLLVLFVLVYSGCTNQTNNQKSTTKHPINHEVGDSVIVSSVGWVTLLQRTRLFKKGEKCIVPKGRITIEVIGDKFMEFSFLPDNKSRGTECPDFTRFRIIYNEIEKPYTDLEKFVKDYFDSI